MLICSCVTCGAALPAPASTTSSSLRNGAEPSMNGMTSKRDLSTSKVYLYEHRQAFKVLAVPRRERFEERQTRRVGRNFNLQRASVCGRGLMKQQQQHMPTWKIGKNHDGMNKTQMSERKLRAASEEGCLCSRHGHQKNSQHAQRHNQRREVSRMTSRLKPTTIRPG